MTHRFAPESLRVIHSRSHAGSRLCAATVRLPILLNLAAGLLLAACSFSPTPSPTPGPAAGSCSLALPNGVSDTDAIRAVLDAEGELVVSQQIDALMALWADGSFVADAKHTPDNTADDQFWHDKDAIRHRYVRIVFPGAPKQATPANLQISLAGDHAEVRATTHIGSETSPGGDRWTMVKQNGCWLIESLTYNLEPQ